MLSSRARRSNLAGLVPECVRRQGGGMDDTPRTVAEQQRIVDELRRECGDEHPDTLAAMLDLAEMLWARGRLAEERVLEEHVVAARRRALGETHGDTLKALGKLAATTGAEGDLAEARRLQEHILALAPEVWGDNVRDTL